MLLNFQKVSLAGQVHLGRDAIATEQADKDVGVSAGSFLVPSYGHHLIHCTAGGKEVPRQREGDVLI